MVKKIFVALLVLLSVYPCFAKPKAEKNKANVVVAQKAKAQKSLGKAESLYKVLMQEYFGA